MVTLTQKQIEEKINFIDSYINAKNAADGSTFDANANVETKNIATLEAEIHKDINIQLNRYLEHRSIGNRYGQGIADLYLEMIKKHIIYPHDETTLKPYTYGASESIVVYKNNKKILTTFENIYSLYSNLNEEILDEKNGVWAKYPNDLYIDSYNGKTKITRLVKKERHRDLLRVKTQYGEDIIVTDNHPMIIGTNVNDTIEAKNSLNKKQYKSKIEFNSDIKEFDTKVLFEDNCYTDYGSFYMSNMNDNKKVEGIRKTIKLSDKLGYIIGFFIAEGCYETNGVIVVQNDETILKKIASYLYEETGIISKLYKDECPSHSERNTKYILRITSGIFKILLSNYFQIKSYAENKNLPMNIFETNKDFVNGVISGMIDGDGSINHSAISIRVASRSLITQLSIILKSFNFGFSNSYQEQKDNFMGSFSSNYPIFGVQFGLTGDLDFNLSEKVSNFKERLTTSTRYIQNETSIKSIKIINNKAFLDNFIYDITTENSEFICNNIRVHNCTSVTGYPLLLDGLKKLGGESLPPQHLESFCGTFVNFVFAISSQFAGAVATVEFLMYFNYFAKKDFGDDYLENAIARKRVENHLQHVVYAINQPAVARGYQSVFWNISIYDKQYFEAMFKEFKFPDFTDSDWDGVKKLQTFFMKWFNKERTKAVLTFPVVTAACLTKNGKYVDEEFKDMLSEEISEGNAFFIFRNENAHALSSCCRLKNDISDSINDFSYSLGAGGVATGSINVITMNLNRIIQEAVKKGIDVFEHILYYTQMVQKFQVAYRDIIQSLKDRGMLMAYDAGFISLDKQYLTLGINGLVEGAEFLGYKISNNDEYKIFVVNVLKTIADENKNAQKQYGFKFNTEFIPGENLGAKNANWDKKDGLFVPRECYNSYLYRVEDEDITIVDKFILQGKDFMQYLDGGSAAHINLESYPTKEGASKLLDIAADVGCDYFCFNVKITICNKCGHIDKRTLHACSSCGSTNIDYGTRIIGYLKRISSFSSARQKESGMRHYHEKKC